MAKIDTMQLENALRDLEYPITKDELVEKLEQHGLNEQARMAVQQLPNHQFRSVGEIMKAVGAFSANSRVN
ncbi:MAG: DUF2795 domain-containing protein [Ktedonobacteraceae bacterium]|nr:DUF2795 domain-containing protein [Ktedonobacteraceae bacterium]